MFGTTQLGSRFNGEKLREHIKPMLDNNQKVILDFANIEEATQSFLDEIFGIFVRAFGTEYIKDKLFIENVKPSIKQTINFVISYSKKRRVA
jgi:hypothetical protein